MNRISFQGWSGKTQKALNVFTSEQIDTTADKLSQGDCTLAWRNDLFASKTRRAFQSTSQAERPVSWRINGWRLDEVVSRLELV